MKTLSFIVKKMTNYGYYRGFAGIVAPTESAVISIEINGKIFKCTKILCANFSQFHREYSLI